MVITTTSAAALAAGSALQGVPADQRPGALLLLALMVGVVLVAAGLARIGRYTRFVSYSVMIGFLTGISVNIVCGQIADLTGAKATGAFPLAKAVNVLTHPANIDLASLLTGLGALAILVLLARTRLAMVSALVALAIPTVVVILAGLDSVARALLVQPGHRGARGRGDRAGSGGRRGRSRPILVAFSGLVAKVALPTLGAILIFAAAGSLRFGEVATILRTGLTSQIAVITTFAAMLFLPVAAAVGIGVALSLLLQLNTEAMDLKVVELVPRDDGRFEEHPAPSALTSNQVTILDVYGSLLYAGSRTLQARLPDPVGTKAPVVVLRLRGRTTLGATFIKMASDYADRLDGVGGRLYLSGLQPTVTDRLHRTGSIEGPMRAFEATPVVGESTRAAYLDAEAWLVRRRVNETPVAPTDAPTRP